MAESNLNLKVTDLRGEVGRFLGWGRDAARWSASKLEEIDTLVSSSLRKFYFQAQLNPQDGAHQWTFLKPVADIVLTIGAETAVLPDDFGGFDGVGVVRSGDQSSGFWPIRQGDDRQIRSQYAASGSVTGRPVRFAEEQIKGTTLTKSNRSRLLVYPVPDAEYTISVAYSILPDYLTAANPYPYGGAAHAETMKAGARAAAEVYLDGKADVESANYLQCLSASIQYDRRHQPKTLGVNTDRSDYLAMRGRSWPDGLWSVLGIGFLGEASYG